MKTAIAIIIALGIALSGANSLLAYTTGPQLSSVKSSSSTDRMASESAFRPLHAAPRR